MSATPVEPDGATPSPLADGDGPLTKYDFYALFWGFRSGHRSPSTVSPQSLSDAYTVAPSFVLSAA